jgi:hypothetical protein
MTTQSHEPQLHELTTMEHRVRRATNANDLRHVLVLLNDLGSRIGEEPSTARGYSLFLSGIAHTKGALLSDSGWIASTVASMQIALDRFVEADSVIKAVIQGHGRSPELARLQCLCAYEAMVAVTTLRAWGKPFDTAPDTNCLTRAEQLRIARHQRHALPLRSRYV